MADLSKQGLWRTELALRIARDCDFEATGQLPAPYRRRKALSVFLSSLAAVMSANPAPRQRVESHRAKRCNFCRNPLVQAVAAIAIAWFAAQGWMDQEFVQDHLTGHNGAIYGETEVVFDE